MGQEEATFVGYRAAFAFSRAMQTSLRFTSVTGKRSTQSVLLEQKIGFSMRPGATLVQIEANSQANKLARSEQHSFCFET